MLENTTPTLDLSVVIPVKNEAEQLKTLLERLTPVLDRLNLSAEILFVNDGSSDQTVETLLNLRKKESRIVVLDLSRNFGKEAALTAGMHYARGQAVITMDADGQDPPELISDFIAHWKNGAEMVVAQRSDRKAEGFIKYKSADWFYRLFNMIAEIQLIPHAGDFRLFDRKVIEAYNRLGERNRFNKGLFAWLGFKQKVITHRREASSRNTRLSSRKLFMLAIDALISFSTIPVRLWMMIGLLSILVASGFTIFIIANTLIYGHDVPGYTSLMVAILMMGGINMIGIALLGEYILRISTETKQRPLYIVRKLHRDD